MCTSVSTAGNPFLATLLLPGLVVVLALTGCASPTSRGDIERRLAVIEQRIAEIAAVTPAGRADGATDATQVERLRAEIARLQGDLDDVRLLLLDLQMKAGR